MLSVARSLMGNPRMLLLDEPCEGLGPLIVESLGEIISSLKAEVPILLTEQNAHFALTISDRGYVIDKGRVRYEGSTGDLVENEEIQLVLETMGAHHFNYVAKDLEVGNYRVSVEICRLTDVDNENDLADAKLMVGPSSLTVEQVRATNTDDGIVFE